MSDNAYRWASMVLMAATAIGTWWTRHDVTVLSGRVTEGRRARVSALVRR